MIWAGSRVEPAPETGEIVAVGASSGAGVEDANPVGVGASGVTVTEGGSGVKVTVGPAVWDGTTRVGGAGVMVRLAVWDGANSVRGV